MSSSCSGLHYKNKISFTSAVANVTCPIDLGLTADESIKKRVVNTVTAGMLNVTVDSTLDICVGERFRVNVDGGSYNYYTPSSSTSKGRVMIDTHASSTNIDIGVAFDPSCISVTSKKIVRSVDTGMFLATIDGLVSHSLTAYHVDASFGFPTWVDYWMPFASPSPSTESKDRHMRVVVTDTETSSNEVKDAEDSVIILVDGLSAVTLISPFVTTISHHKVTVKFESRTIKFLTRLCGW
jgi:hypothetical protein